MSTTREDRVALVTGGARGIGLAAARHLAAEGCRVVLWDLGFEGFDETEAGLSPALRGEVDVASWPSVEAAMGELLARLGRLDILVNNAGINGPVAPLDAYPLDAWAQVLAVDLGGVFHCCRAAVPAMRRQDYGRIVNVASIAGKEGTPGVSAYCAAKAGVIGLTKALARELVTEGVTVNAVAPVMAETAILEQMTPEHIAAARAKIPMGRFCTVDEIAATIAWIASPACSFTTGFVFDVSGGRADY